VSESRPLFMRLPATAAERLDVIARDQGESKGEIVTRLILDNNLSVGQHSFRPNAEPAVLTPAQAAELLQVEERLVTELATTGQLPGRRLGDQWRFSRHALIQWLEAAETVSHAQ
jgi:excisionase family DNA binding protein